MALALSRRIPKAEDAFALAAFTPLALLYRRHVAFFVLAAAPILARHLPLALETLRASSRRWLVSVSRSNGAWPAALVLALQAYLLATSILSRSALTLGIEESRFPARAASFIQTEQPAARMFNLYDWGGYLIWRLAPRTKVFVDGRLVLYGDLIRDYFQIQDGSERWQELLDRRGVTLALTNHDYVLSMRLAESPDWTLVHVSEPAVVYAKNIPENRDLIARFGYRAIHPDRATFCIAAEAPQALAELERALRGDSGSARLHFYRGQALSLLSRGKEAEDAMRRAVG